MGNELIVQLARRLYARPEFRLQWERLLECLKDERLLGGELNNEINVALDSMIDAETALLGEGIELFEYAKQAFEVAADDFGICESLVATCRFYLNAAVRRVMESGI